MTALTTSAVGSYPKPDYVKKARGQFARGEISRSDLEILEHKATEEWIRVQERLDIDVPVHGEMERGDMAAHFAEIVDSMKIGGLVRSYGNRYYHKPIIVDKVQWQGPMTVDTWKLAQGMTNRPVKGMLTGPYTMVEWSFDEYYPSRREAVLDWARLLNQESKELQKAGAKYIQVDEPAIHTRPDEDFDLAVEAMAIVVDGVDAEFHTHICYGDVSRIYPGVLRLPVKKIHLAFKNTNWQLLDLVAQEWPDDKVLGLGVTDVHTLETESVDEVKEGIHKALQLLPPDQIWIEPDCGLKTRTVKEAEAQLAVMMEAVHQVRQEIGIG